MEPKIWQPSEEYDVRVESKMRPSEGEKRHVERMTRVEWGLVYRDRLGALQRTTNLQTMMESLKVLDTTSTF